MHLLIGIILRISLNSRIIQTTPLSYSLGGGEEFIAPVQHKIPNYMEATFCELIHKYHCKNIPLSEPSVYTGRESACIFCSRKMFIFIDNLSLQLPTLANFHIGYEYGVILLSLYLSKLYYIPVECMWSDYLGLLQVINPDNPIILYYTALSDKRSNWKCNCIK